MVRLLLGHVVVPALGVVYEDECLIVQGNEADAVRAMHTTLLQNLDTPASQVCADCHVRPLSTLFPISVCPLVLGSLL